MGAKSERHYMKLSHKWPLDVNNNHLLNEVGQSIVIF